MSLPWSSFSCSRLTASSLVGTVAGLEERRPPSEEEEEEEDLRGGERIQVQQFKLADVWQMN